MPPHSAEVTDGALYETIGSSTPHVTPSIPTEDNIAYGTVTLAGSSTPCASHITNNIAYVYGIPALQCTTVPASHIPIEENMSHVW